MAETQVLIVGAGPTGLLLALVLTKLGVSVRIIDKTDAPGTTSRAIVFHARNLEFYRQLGLADAVIAGGLKFSEVNLWVGGKQAAHVSFGDLGDKLSRYPFMLIFPQDAHEQLLVEELGKIGINVERQTELITFKQNAAGIHAQVKLANETTEDVSARYLAGCDGARSTVREVVGAGFAGGTYADVFFVADADAAGAQINGQTHAALDDADFLVMFPMKGQSKVRFVGAVRNETRAASGEPRWENVNKRVIDQLKIKVNHVSWFSTYHVHHRLASSFRHGNAFLLGDAAHIHSPVGGQGMNTGLGDAVNLAWKLAAVLQHRMNPSVLDTYDPERIAFARRLVNTTDRAFQFVTARGPIATRVRLTVVPFLFPKLLRMRSVRRFMFRTLSQIAIRYPTSRLSAGSAGDVKGGDRLPWVEFEDADGNPTDNYAPLDMRNWQVHCYGHADVTLVAACTDRGLRFHAFPWRPVMIDAGFAQNAYYVVRPDGYVGLASPAGADAKALVRYLDTYGIRATAK